MPARNPFYQDLATSYLKELNKMMQFQSTLETLKDPPPSDTSNKVDLLGELESIQAKVDAGTYTSHYVFETDVRRLLQVAHDGHLVITPCTTRIFNFHKRPYQLFSTSQNGIDLPQLYLAVNNTPVGSPVTTIDGQNSIDYLNSVSGAAGYQDPDARYNDLFPSFGQRAQEGAEDLGGRFTIGDFVWPGNIVTTIGFENASVVEVPTIVSVTLNNPSSITDGDSLFKSFCIPSPTEDQDASTFSPTETETATDVGPPPTEPEATFSSLVKRQSSATPTSSASPDPTNTAPTFPKGPLGYPVPESTDGFGNFAGYYLNSETAVLSLPRFEIKPEAREEELTPKVQDLQAEFITSARTSGRTKLMIDLTRNGGGTVALGYNLFRLLFPTELPYSASRFRRNPAIDVLTEFVGAVDKTTLESNIKSFSRLSVTPQLAVRPDQITSVGSAQDLLGDNIVQLNTLLSSLFALYNYTLISELQVTQPIRGYGPIQLASTSPPFAPEDILIITDGTCTSTCTTFVNLMTNAGNVRSIAFGGRAQNGPMQVMGGVRGLQAIRINALAEWFDSVEKNLQLGPTKLTEEQMKIWNETRPQPTSKWPVKVTTIGVNFRNAYQKGDDELPQQFMYQADDCRLFYTTENILQPETQWRDAKKAIWGGGKCVPDSEGAEGSREWRETHGNNLTNSTSTPKSNDGAATSAHYGTVSVCLAATVVLMVLL